MHGNYTVSPTPATHTAPGYEDIVAAALLDQHGGRNRLRLITDEDLYRARLALRRAEYDALDALDVVGPVATCTLVLGLSLARGAVEDEEARRERGRFRGVPRDLPSAWVPEALRERLRREVSIVDLFHRWGLTELRELRGGKWVGRCPFHADDSPSLYVYTADPTDQHWHCFGCQQHGDAIDLAMRHTGQSFRDCCEGLASAAGIPWPEPPTTITPKNKPAMRPSTRVVLAPRQGA